MRIRPKANAELLGVGNALQGLGGRGREEMGGHCSIPVVGHKDK